MTLISFIIPVYNTGQYLYSSINSIYQQSLIEDDFEIIIVDDGSTDCTEEVIQHIKEQHSNITIIQQKNSGVSAARNNGLQHANGKYIHFIDADDLLVKDSITPVLQLAKEESLDFVYIQYIEFNNRQSDSKTPKNEGFEITLFNNGYDYFIKQYASHRGRVWSYLFRKDFLLEHSLLFNPKINFCEDALYCLQVFTKAKRCGEVNTIAYLYRQHNQSAIYLLDKKKLLSLNIVIQELNILLCTYQVKDRFYYKLHDIIYDYLTLSLISTAKIENAYGCKKEIIRDLKHRVPLFISTKSLLKIRFCLFYNLCPQLYVYLKHKSNKQNDKR